MGSAAAVFACAFCVKTVLPDVCPWRVPWRMVMLPILAFGRCCSARKTGVYASRRGGREWRHQRLRTDDAPDPDDGHDTPDDDEWDGDESEDNGIHGRGYNRSSTLRFGPAKVVSREPLPSRRGRQHATRSSSVSAFGRAGQGLCDSTLAALTRLRDGLNSNDEPSVVPARSDSSIAQPPPAHATLLSSSPNPSCVRVTYAVGSDRHDTTLDVMRFRTTLELLEAVVEAGDRLLGPGSIPASRSQIWYHAMPRGESRRFFVTKTTMADIRHCAGLLVVKLPEDDG